MKAILLTGKDGKQFNVSIWDEVENARAVIQIAHGMAEYSARYDSTALEFNKMGYIVVGDDHRGHGVTCGGLDKRGQTEGNPFFDTVSDMAVLTDYAKDTYGLPVILLGHSYGSFLSQCYITQFADKLAGVILSGSANMNNGLVKTGAKIAKFQASLIDGKKPAKMIEKMSFGSYDKAFPQAERPFAWLSRDTEQVQKYRADDYCGHVMCINFQSSFLNGVTSIYTPERLGAIPKDLPVFIASGSMDPVGNQGKLVQDLYDCYTKEAQLQNVTMKLYENARHEILNETNRAEVRADMAEFVEKCLTSRD